MKPMCKAESSQMYSRKCHGKNVMPGESKRVKNLMNRAKRRLFKSELLSQENDKHYQLDRLA